MTTPILLLIMSASAQQIGWFETGSADQHFGHSVAVTGDFNQDSIADFAVTAMTLPLGSVQVFSGADQSLLWDFPSPAAGSRFGWSMDGAGDVDGDGVADLLVGAPGEEFQQIRGGVVRVYSGATGLILWEIPGPDMTDEYGYSVAGVGDWNGDGHDDFAFGSPQSREGASLGYFAVHSGADGQVLYSERGANTDGLGLQMASGGDLNGDGRADLLVSTRSGRRHPGDAAVGSVRAYAGGSGLLLAEWFGDTAGAQFGASLDFAGDLNGDGLDDVLAGTQWLSNRNYARAINAADGEVLLEWRSMDDDGWAGAAVAGIGDLDQDGYADVAIGDSLDPSFAFAAGAIRIYSGRNGTLLQTLRGNKAFLGFGRRLAAGADWNQDGLPDLLVANPAAHFGQPNHGFVMQLWLQTPPLLTVRGLQAGSLASLSVERAPAGAWVAFHAGTHGYGFAPSPIHPEAYLDLQAPLQFLAASFANASGQVQLSLWTPPNLAGRTLSLQALVLSPGRQQRSSAVQQTVLP